MIFFLSFDFFQPPKPRSCPKDARVSDTAGFLLKVMGEPGFPVRPVQTGVGKQRGAPAPAQPAAEGAGQGSGSRSSKPSQRSPEAAPCSGASRRGGLRNSQGCQKNEIKNQIRAGREFTTNPPARLGESKITQGSTGNDSPRLRFVWVLFV